MIIQICSREHAGKNKHITDYFDAVGVKYHRSKNYIADYINLDNPGVYVERKANLTEFAGNAGKQHDRFKRELERLDGVGGKMFVVIEEPIKRLENLVTMSRIPRSQMKPEVLYKICRAWQEKHNLEFVFCYKGDAGRIIKELLEK
jgi:hypothetical protein